MPAKTSTNPESDLPAGLAQPAVRALTTAGYVRLEQLAQVSETRIQQLHGIGPKALVLLRQALNAKGLAFASDTSTGSVKSAVKK